MDNILFTNEQKTEKSSPVFIRLFIKSAITTFRNRNKRVKKLCLYLYNICSFTFSYYLLLFYDTKEAISNLFMQLFTIHSFLYR